MNELKPCPFCGGQAYLDEWGCVVCHDCNAHSDIKPTTDEAIAAWNSRVDLA